MQSPDENTQKAEETGLTDAVETHAAPTPPDLGEPQDVAHPVGDLDRLPVSDETIPAPQPAPVDDFDAPLPEVEPFTPKSVEMNVTETRPVSKPIPEGEEPKSLAEFVTVMRETSAVLKQALEHSSAVMTRQMEAEARLAESLGRKADSIPDDQGNPHLRLLLGAITNMVGVEGDRHERALYREGAEWGQTIEHEGKIIGGGIPVQRLAADGKYSREELKSYVTRKAGVGGTVDIPLWHSGIWLRFRAPALLELTAMNQEVANVKVSVGSETRGLAFSNVSHYIRAIVVDFALQHVINANVSYATPTDLKEMIDTRDIPAVILGIAATLYPTGYPYANPCIADLGKCTHVVKELLQVVNLWWVDKSALTQWQRAHMAHRIDSRAPRTKEDIATYKSHHTVGRERMVRIGSMGFLLACPNAYEHEELGRAWLDGIIEMTQGAFNEPPEGRNRAVYINQLAEVTSAREYAHWVKAIVDIDEDTPEGFVILSEEKDFITEILSDVYSSDEHIGEFVKKVEEYIDDSLLAMTGITSYNCPCCNTPTATEFKKRFVNIVPVDPMVEFFTLASRKLSRIM